MPHTFTNLLVHSIFSTKERSPVINSDLKPRLFGYMGGIIRESKGTLIAANGPADHVHLLMLMPQDTALSDLMRVVKANSSRWVHQEWPGLRAFAWQVGYGAFSVSQSNTETVKQYIAEQEEHHRRVSFQEEFVAFLKRHGISYDERFIWE